MLHQWDWSETSLILDLFTRDQGRVAVVAKGAKRPYSQLRPVLLPFQRLMVLLTRPRSEAGAVMGNSGGGGDILTLRSADYAGAGAVLPPALLVSGFYLNELLLKLLARNDPHERLFDAYADTLQALVAEPDEAPLRAFELQLLRACGVLPELDRATLTQERVLPGTAYLLQPDIGLVAASRDELALRGSDAMALQAALDADDDAALRQASRGALPALKAQLRGLLHYHLGSPQLRTRQLMLDVRRLLDSPNPTTPSPGSP